jgi:hypothetical protein
MRRDADRAWHEARWFARTLYHPQVIPRDRCYGDEAIDGAARGIGGYDAILMCNVDALPELKRRFCERYDELTDVIEAREKART